jgi:hypothetical protein
VHLRQIYYVRKLSMLTSARAAAMLKRVKNTGLGTGAENISNVGSGSAALGGLVVSLLAAVRFEVSFMLVVRFELDKLDRSRKLASRFSHGASSSVASDAYSDATVILSPKNAAAIAMPVVTLVKKKA